MPVVKFTDEQHQEAEQLFQQFLSDLKNMNYSAKLDPVGGLLLTKLSNALLNGMANNKTGNLGSTLSLGVLDGVILQKWAVDHGINLLLNKDV